GIGLTRAGDRQRRDRSEVDHAVVVMGIVDTDVPTEATPQPEDVCVQVELHAAVVHTAQVLQVGAVTGGVRDFHGDRLVGRFFVEIGALEVYPVLEETDLRPDFVGRGKLRFQVLFGVGAGGG